MEITYVYHTDYALENAHGKQIVHTCNALSQLGHKVTVVCSGDIHNFAEGNGIVIDFDVVHHPIHLPKTRPDQLAYFIYSSLVAKNSDVLITRDIRFLKFLALAPRIHRWLPPILYEAHKAYHIVEDMNSVSEMQYLSIADAIIAISPGVKSALQELSVSNIQIVPDAAPLEMKPIESKETLRTKCNLPKSDTIFIYAGSFSLEKTDMEIVIQGIAKLSESIQCRLVLLGGSPTEVKRVNAIADKHGFATENLVMTGRVPHRTVFDYLMAADIGLIPLRSDSTTFSLYTSPLKLYEYLMCELSVVATDVPAISQTHSDDPTVTLYSDGNVKEFVEACKVAIKEDYVMNDIDQISYSRRAEDIESILHDITA